MRRLGGRSLLLSAPARTSHTPLPLACGERCSARRHVERSRAQQGRRRKVKRFFSQGATGSCGNLQRSLLNGCGAGVSLDKNQEQHAVTCSSVGGDKHRNWRETVPPEPAPLVGEAVAASVVDSILTTRTCCAHFCGVNLCVLTNDVKHQTLLVSQCTPLCNFIGSQVDFRCELLFRRQIRWTARARRWPRRSCTTLLTAMFL